MTALEHLHKPVANKVRRPRLLHIEVEETNLAFGDRAALRRKQIGNCLQRCRLAGAVGAEKCDDLSFGGPVRLTSCSATIA